MKEITKKIQNIKPLNDAYTKWKWRERTVSLGKQNEELSFYVIRRAKSDAGLFSYVMTCIGGIKEAVDRGYVPVVDMQNEANTYLEEAKIGRDNAWEYYFEQPFGYTLSDVAGSKNVILGNGLLKGQIHHPDIDLCWDNKKYEYWHSFGHSYLRIKPELLRQFEAETEFLKDFRLLGVLARGTDYVTLRLKNHPIQPTVNGVIQKIDEALKKHGFDKIYLATEDADIYEEMKAAYGEMLLAPGVRRYTTREVDNINRMSIDRENDRYLKGVEYLKSIWILSRCNGLIAGAVSGTVGALLLNDSYEYRYIFNLGTH